MENKKEPKKEDNILAMFDRAVQNIGKYECEADFHEGFKKLIISLSKK